MISFSRKARVCIPILHNLFYLRRGFYRIYRILILEHLIQRIQPIKNNRRRTRDVTLHTSKQSFIARSFMVRAYSFLPDIEYCGDSWYVDR